VDNDPEVVHPEAGELLIAPEVEGFCAWRVGATGAWAERSHALFPSRRKAEVIPVIDVAAGGSNYRAVPLGKAVE
jgi:hypothetical protein